MRRIICLMMIVTLCLGMTAGCGSKKSNENTSAGQTTPAAASETAGQAAPAPAAETADDPDEEDEVEGELVIYTSMYPFAIEMMDEALKEKFPELVPGNDGSFFFYSGTTALITKIYGEMG